MRRAEPHWLAVDLLMCCCNRSRLPLTFSGLTLLELLVAIGVAALVLSAGAPALRHLVLEASITHQVNSFVRAVHLARQMSQLQITNVAICPGSAQLQCNLDGDWSAGWLVFLNTDGDQPPQRDPGEQILLVEPAWADGRIAANRRAFAFRPFSIRDTNGTVVFCDARGPDAGRAVVISPSGRPRLVFGGSPQVDSTCAA